MTPPAPFERYQARNRGFWDADADDYQAVHGPLLGEAPMAWGVWRIPEAEVGVLGDTTGRRMLEYGCGAAQWSIALAAKGAQPVGVDQSIAQLRHARALARQRDVEVPLVYAGAEQTPFPAASFDVVFCDHGAMTFCPPERTLPEVARVLRDGGTLAFSHTTPLLHLTWSAAKDRETRRLRAPYFGLRGFDAPEGTVDFQRPYGEWIRLFRRHGFTVEDLVELRPPEGATTTYGLVRHRWARRWPAEQVWKLRKE